MSDIITSKPHYLNRLHESLPRAGGSVADYYVEGGGYDPETGQPRPDYLRVRTDVIDQALLTAVGEAHDSLSLTGDKDSILADGDDTTTITCADATIAGESAVDYTVWLDGEVYTQTTGAPVSGGPVQLTLTTDAAGEYLIESSRQGAGNYQTGYLTITAQEVD